MRIVDLAGQRFGRLVAVERVGAKGGNSVWKCKCDCGAETMALASNLGRNTRSCGCLRREVMPTANLKHGFRGHPLYNVFSCMLERCYSESHQAYHNYGGRGISICDGWRANRAKFITWALTNGWKAGLTIDRTDNDGPYSPENCRIITRAEQDKNKRTNVFVEYNNERLILADFMKKYAVVADPTIRSRRRKGMSLIEAAITPRKSSNQYAKA